MSRVSSKRGSVLFIVLVIMSFMIILASAVYYAVQNGRQSVVMDYSDQQAFQTANDVLNAMDRYLTTLVPDASSGIGDLNTAISTLKTNCGLTVIPSPPLYPARDCTLPFGHADYVNCRAVRPSNSPDPAPVGEYCGAAVWNDASNMGKTLDQLIAESELPTTLVPFKEGVHYLRGRQTVNNLRGGGDTVDVLIYVNRHGEIVIEVTVEYNGRRVNLSRFYSAGDQRQFAAYWLNPGVTEGKALHWEWVEKDLPRPSLADGTFDPSYSQVNVGTTLFDACWLGGNANNGYARRRVNDICRKANLCIDRNADECPQASTGGCFDPTRVGSAPGSGNDNDPDITGVNQYQLIGGCHSTNWDACHIGNGWWIWVGDTTGTGGRPAAGSTAPAGTQWAGVRWDNWCHDGEMLGSACVCRGSAVAPFTYPNKAWLIGRVPGPAPGQPPPDPSDEPEPVGRNDDGTYTYGPPCVFTWRQRDAFHITGIGLSDAESINTIANRGTASPTHYDTKWTVLQDVHGSRRGYFRGDISTLGSLLIGDVYIDNPVIRTKPIEITVRENLLVGGQSAKARGNREISGLNNLGGGATTGIVEVKVKGDLYTFGGGHFGDNVTYYVTDGDLFLNGASAPGSATFYVGVNSGVYNGTGNNPSIISGSGETNNLPARVVRMTVEETAQINDAIDFRTGPTDTDKSWPSPATPRDMTPRWDGAKADDWGTSTNTNNPLTNQYDIAINDTIRNGIFYINESAVIRNPAGDGVASGSTLLIIVDTGLEGTVECDATSSSCPENLSNGGSGTCGEKKPKEIHLDLRANTTGGNFRWRNGLEDSVRLAVLTLGNGVVVINSTNVTYLAGGENGGDGSGRHLFVGPFNLAVGRDTANTDWIQCPRLMDFTRALNTVGVPTHVPGTTYQGCVSPISADICVPPGGGACVEGACIPVNAGCTTSNCVCGRGCGRCVTTPAGRPDHEEVGGGDNRRLWCVPGWSQHGINCRVGRLIGCDPATDFHENGCIRPCVDGVVHYNGCTNGCQGGYHMPECIARSCRCRRGDCPAGAAGVCNDGGHITHVAACPVLVVCNFTNGANRHTGACQWGCWLNGLLDSEGSGAIRSDDELLARGIRQRNHSSALNLHVYLVNNGNTADRIRFGQWAFHAVTVYAPRMSFVYTASAGDRVVLFGSLFVARLDIGTMDHFISMMPGGGIGIPPTPYDPPGFGAPDVSGSGAGSDTFSPYDGIGSGSDPGRR